MTRYITASIPYVNATPHIGHALEFVQVDALLRYYKTQGENVRAQFGSDDNSLKNVRAAEAAGEDVEAFVARHAQSFRDLLTSLNIDSDNFMRTREERHVRGAQKLWSLFKPDDVYKKSYEGLYCVGCEQFYAAEETIDGACPTHKKRLEVIREENWFFKLTNYQTQIEHLLESGILNLTPDSRKNEMLAFVKRGLEDFSISRSVARAQNWGVPVPNDPGQVMYVWVDALSNYITALGFADDAEEYKTFWEQANERVHVIGKDITRFHTIYWPAFLLSAGLPLPTEVFVHGFLTNEGQKMSKSIGNVIAPMDLVQRYGVDATRFLLLRALPLTSDGDLSHATLDEQYNQLANGLGNLVGRVAAMANKYFEGVVDQVDVRSVDLVQSAHGGLNLRSFVVPKIIDRLPEEIGGYDFKRYLESVWELVDYANLKVQIEEPFKTAKTDLPACKKTLSELAAMIRVIAEALAPIMPSISAEIGRRYTGETLIHGEPLFPKSEVPVI